MRDKAKPLDYPVYVFLWKGWADDGDQEKVLNRKGTFPLLLSLGSQRQKCAESSERVREQRH